MLGRFRNYLEKLAQQQPDIYWRLCTATLVHLLSRCSSCPKFPCRLYIEDSSYSVPEECVRHIIDIANQIEEAGREHVVKLASRIMPRDLPTLDKICEARLCILKLACPGIDVRELVVESLGVPYSIVKLMFQEDVEDLYITHQGVKVCLRGGEVRDVAFSKVVLEKALNTFVNLAELAGLDLCTDSPSGLYCLRLDSTVFRIAVDVWPKVEKVTVHVRKHAKLFTLRDLELLGTLSQTEAQMLLTIVERGHSLLIGGPPGSGKTTLVNALLMELRPRRAVYVDEADELTVPDVIVIKYRSIDGRLEEIERTLYRGGGLLVIGELRKREHYEALRLALESGLQVLATVHCRDLDDLYSKFRRYAPEVADRIGKDVSVAILNFVNGRRRLVQLLSSVSGKYRPIEKYLKIPSERQVTKELGP